MGALGAGPRPSTPAHGRALPTWRPTSRWPLRPLYRFLGGTRLGDATHLLHRLVFVMALVQGKSFWTAVKMGVGVIILGIVAIIVLGVAFGLLKITLALLSMVLWVVLIYAVLVFVVRMIRGTT